MPYTVPSSPTNTNLFDDPLCSIVGLFGLVLQGERGVGGIRVLDMQGGDGGGYEVWGDDEEIDQGMEVQKGGGGEGGGGRKRRGER